MNKPEILAPAGSFDSLTAAVRCGADAVYLGGRELNARRNAANFSDEELAQAVEYCHARGVKVYITLNTLVRDDEMETAMNAVAEMVRQTGSPAFSGDMLKKGVIVRHLVLPYHYRDSVEVIKRTHLFYRISGSLRLFAKRLPICLCTPRHRLPCRPSTE